MIEIKKNEELYYSLPIAKGAWNSHHTPPNMVFKTIIYLKDGFHTAQVREKIYELWGVKMNTPKVSRAIRVLYDVGVVERSRSFENNYEYIYEKTNLFHKMCDGVESKGI